MITGIVTEGREAIVRLKLRGTNGVEADIETVIDTGFTESFSLPQSWVIALALPMVNTDRVTLADGTIIDVELYEVSLDWEGQERTVIAHCMEGSPLIGMSLLYDHLLTMHVIENGDVNIEPVL